jgi:hypothetical protein
MEKTDNIIDSREVNERITELEEQRDAYNEQPDCDDVDWKMLHKDEHEELEHLVALRDDLEGYCEWDAGETLINRSYFVEYVEEMCKDIGAIPRNIPSYIEIDWEATAANIETDYTSGYWDGEEFLVRCS